MSQIDPEAKLSDIALRWPATVPIFSRHGLDLCCGGGHSLSVAAQKHKLDLHSLLTELNGAIELERAVK